MSDERNITDEEVVAAAEMNEELSFHDAGPVDDEDDDTAEERNCNLEEEEDPMVITRPRGPRKFTDEFKKTCSLAAEASFAIANFDGLLAM